jgi:hypothetical protein
MTSSALLVYTAINKKLKIDLNYQSKLFIFKDGYPFCDFAPILYISFYNLMHPSGRMPTIKFLNYSIFLFKLLGLEVSY